MRQKTFILTILFAILGMIATLAPLIPLPQPFLLNATASMPQGVYLQSSPTTLHRGAIVVFPLPERVWANYGELMRSWGWSPAQGPLLKRVGALPGDHVCVVSGMLSINGVEQAEQLTHDTHGNPIPGMQGCITVQPGAFLPLSTHSPQSFDGRYYGVIPTHLIKATARPLWTLAGEGDT